jgi:DNA repair exonuclease SbcCD ATPase subunit
MIHTEQPHFGHFKNWSLISRHIQCWADAVGALVYGISGEAVLALDEEDAVRTVALKVSNHELQQVRREIRDIERKIAELEDELEECEEEEADLLKKRNRLRGYIYKPAPEWLQKHPTLF